MSCVGPRHVSASDGSYAIDQAGYSPANIGPPCCRRAGTDVGEILQASQRLAHAQSERQATACRLLPPVHWALLYTIGLLFVSTFILFETGGSFSNEGRHILFTVLVGVMSFVLCVRPLAGTQPRCVCRPLPRAIPVCLKHRTTDCCA